MSSLPPNNREDLSGRHLLWLRESPAIRQAAERCRNLGAMATIAPVSEIADPPDFAPLDRALFHLDQYDWLMITSKEGVARLLSRLATLRRRLPPSIKIAAIGDKTADALREHRIPVSVVPSHLNQEGLIQALKEIPGWQGTRVLLPLADRARSQLAKFLEAQGALVDRVVLYQSRVVSLPDSVLQKITLGNFDAIFYTAPSSAEFLFQQLSQDQQRIVQETWAISIGPTTSTMLKKLGFGQIAETSSPSIADMVDKAILVLGPC